MNTPTDEAYMRQALALAQQAAQSGEVPVGAVLVHQGRVIGSGHNAPISSHDPTAHAEVAALRAAATQLGNYRLEDCELYVTLEPCPMCAGALMQARLKRVVFGAHDPKTGAAGSVLDLFAVRQFNHHTQVQGGVLSTESGALLQEFFQHKRAQQRQLGQPVREDCVRTPEDRFSQLPDYPWQPRYVSDLPALAGLRMHYVDEGPHDASQTWLCLHDSGSWSYLYRKMIAVFLTAGHRVVAPDLIGLGKSDKPKKEAAHSFTWHRQVLLEFVQRMDLQRVVLVGDGWGSLLGLTLPIEAPERYCGLLLMNSSSAPGSPPLTDQEIAAYEAPFPDRGHRAALRAFATTLPVKAEHGASVVALRAREFWCRPEARCRLVAAGRHAPALGGPVTQAVYDILGDVVLHSLSNQERNRVPDEGDEVARAALRHFLVGSGVLSS